MKASYTLDIDDLMSFQEDYLTTSKDFFKLKLFNSLIWSILLMILVLMYTYFKGINVALLWITSFASIYLFLAFFITFKKYYLKNIKKNFEESDTKNILGNITMEINNEVFIVKINENEEKIKYQSLCKTQENENYIYLYTVGNAAHILPKKKISNVEGGTTESFLEYIRTHIKKS